MAASAGVNGDTSRLPRLLYIGDVAIADTSAGEALLYRLLQFYPPDKLAVVCRVNPGVTMLPGVAYHHWGATFPRLFTTRVAQEYYLWRAWKYYRIPRALADLASEFKAEAILSISHVSGWLAAWQLAEQRRLPLHLIAHDDFVYEDRFPQWARPWAAEKFGLAYRAATGRFCISEAMAEAYQQRFGAPASILYPTSAPTGTPAEVCPQVGRSTTSLKFAYGGSINTPAQVEQIVTFGRIAGAMGHRLIVYSPQHEAMRQAVGSESAFDIREPVHSAELRRRLREEADCMLLPQSMDPADRDVVATQFQTKWADYSTMGLPLVVWAPEWSSSARFIERHPGCAELIAGNDEASVQAGVGRLAASPEYRLGLARTLLSAGTAFSPEAGWQTFRDAVSLPC